MTDADEDAYVCQRTADWCDRMLIEFDLAGEPPDAPLVDIERRSSAAAWLADAANPPML